MRTITLSIILTFILSWSLWSYGSSADPSASTASLTANNQTRVADAHPIVAGYERFIEDDRIAEVDRGLLLLNELNCLSCHQSETKFWATSPRVAPILSEVGKRVQPEYFEKFIRDPHGVKPGTSMPDLLAGRPESQRELVAKAIGHYLASTGTTQHQPTSPKEITRGEELFHNQGCVACHNPQNSDEEISTSIPLGKLSDKYTVPSLTRFLKNPLHSRPSGRMPSLPLDNQELQSISAYLLKDIQIDANINYTLYQGLFERLPDFTKLEAHSNGTVPSLDLKNLPFDSKYAVILSGFWKVETAGTYKFQIGSDDGSRLIVDGERFIDNDGKHGMEFKQGEIELTAGLHEFHIEYFQGTGGQNLECNVEGESVGIQSLGNLLQNKKDLDESTEAGFKVDENLATQGKVFFTSIGCANCHEMKSDDQLIASRFPVQKPLAQLNAEAGCVAGSLNAPSFRFSEAQKKSLAAAIDFLSNQKPDIDADTDAMAHKRIHQRLTTMNCYSCHSRETGERGSDEFQLFGGAADKTGGESLEIYDRDKWFTSTEAEMGDEGRHPPGLKLVGAKLNPDWFRHILDKSSKDRPYMLTEMPRFGLKNLDGLIEDFQKTDKLPQKIEVTQTEPIRQVKIHGRALSGEDGLSCIKCHTFGDYASTGVPALSMTTMTKRLNEDWFQLYLLKPSNFRRGTRMPESWPDGKTFYPDLLDGDTNKQINAIWEYLKDGPNAAKPVGLVKPKLEVAVKKEPMIYRNFIEGVGPRGIGVGYPEGVNVAFDADNCRMAMVWQEKFIDGSRHWTGRGVGFEGPLGENILALPESIGFFGGDPAAWPQSDNKETARELGVRFGGYELNEQLQPIFLYSIGDTNITDQPVPRVVEGFGYLDRKFTISASKAPVHYRAAVGGKIEKVEGGFLIDGRLTTKISGNVESSIVEQDGKSALVITIAPADQATSFEQTYDW